MKKCRHVCYEPLVPLLHQPVAEDQCDQREDEDAQIWGQEPHDGPGLFQRESAGDRANTTAEDTENTSTGKE